MRVALCACLAMLALLAVSGVQANSVSLHDESELESVVDIASDEAEGEEEEAELELENELGTEDESEEEEEEADEEESEEETEEDSSLLAVNSKLYLQSEAEIDAAGRALFREMVAALDAECMKKCSAEKTPALKAKCVKACSAAATAPKAPTSNSDCAATCARKQGNFKTECLKQCEARKTRKNGKDLMGMCEACDVNPKEQAACCAKKTGCEIKTSGMIGFRKSTCTAKSATDKRLTERDLQQKVEGSSLKELIAKGTEWLKTKAADAKEKAIQDAIDKFIKNNRMREVWRCHPAHIRKAMVVDAIGKNVAKIAGELIGSQLGGYLGKMAGGFVGAAIGKVSELLPFKEKVTSWLVAKAVSMVLKSAGGAGGKAIGTPDSALAIVKAQVNKHWDSIRRRVYSEDNGPTDMPVQTEGCKQVAGFGLPNAEPKKF